MEKGTVNNFQPPYFLEESVFFQRFWTPKTILPVHVISIKSESWQLIGELRLSIFVLNIVRRRYIQNVTKLK